MSELSEKIQKAKSYDELKSVVDSIPLLENGIISQLAMALLDGFSYRNLDDLNKKKAFMLLRVKMYKS